MKKIWFVYPWLEKSNIDWVHWNEMHFALSFMFCFKWSPWVSLVEWFSFDEPTGQWQTTNNNEEMKIIKFLCFFLLNCHFSFSRAIRTRTVDILGKTDQTYYYQNDLNCFKDPTCIFFLHWALSLTDINIS